MLTPADFLQEVIRAQSAPINLADRSGPDFSLWC
jgi:hypothetical protein